MFLFSADGATIVAPHRIEAGIATRHRSKSHAFTSRETETHAAFNRALHLANRSGTPCLVVVGRSDRDYAQARIACEDTQAVAELAVTALDALLGQVSEEMRPAFLREVERSAIERQRARSAGGQGR